MATADLHLKESEESDRLAVMRWLCQQATENDVTGLLVAGDLFDSAADGRNLAPAVEDVFEEELPADTPVVMVPGNHDENLGQLGWSRRVRVLDRGGQVTLETEGEPLHVHGLPYNRGESFESVGDVFDLSDTGVHLLLSHASFLSPKHRHLLTKIEESDEDNQYVLHADDFRDSSFAQILLGHWHGFQPLMDRPPVHYVGSPIPNSRNEEGEKGYVLGDVQSEGIALSQEEVDHPPGWYFRNREYLVVPGYEAELLDRLRSDIEPEQGSRTRVRLNGYTRRDRETFRREVEDILDEKSIEGGSYSLEIDLQTAEEMDAPLIDRMFEALDETGPSDRLSVEELASSSDPDRVVSAMRRLLEDDPESIRHRARKFFLEALVGVLES